MKAFRKNHEIAFPMRYKYENKPVLINIQFSIDLTGSHRGVIGPNESFKKSHEKNYETDKYR